jgi:hypothetical protein
VEPSALQRRLAFGLIVVVLAGLATYLLGNAAHGAGQPADRPAATATSSSPAPSIAASLPAASASGTPGTDIYRWLPFSRDGLAAAASVARRFGAAYGTFSYQLTPAQYASGLQSLCSAALASRIEAAYAAPGVAAARAAAHQVSVGTASIQSIRSFGPSSLTFVVQVTEKQTSASGPGSDVTSFALTLTGGGASWQVTDIELASLGNA